MASEQPDLTRLKSTLVKSGLQIKDTPLYQVINGLIDATKQFQDITNKTIESLTNSVTNNNTIISNLGSQRDFGISLLELDNPSDDSGIMIPGPQGMQGIQGIKGFNGSDGFDGQDGNDGLTILKYNILPYPDGTALLPSINFATEIALGIFKESSGSLGIATNTLVITGETGVTAQMIIGRGRTNSVTDLAFIIGTGGTGADNGGYTLVLSGGPSTGNTAGGAIQFRTNVASGVSSSTPNTPTERGRFSSTGVGGLTINYTGGGQAQYLNVNTPAAIPTNTDVIFAASGTGKTPFAITEAVGQTASAFKIYKNGSGTVAWLTIGGSGANDGYNGGLFQFGDSATGTAQVIIGVAGGGAQDGVLKLVEGNTSNAYRFVASQSDGKLRIKDPAQVDRIIMATNGDLTFGSPVTMSNSIVKYNNVTTVGWGIVAVYANGRSVAATAGVATVSTYTVGAADGSFYVSANINITTSTAFSFSCVVTYTDEGGTSRALTLNFSQLTGTFVTTITNILGAGAYEGVPLHIRAKASTSITISTSGTFTTVTYNVEGLIVQLS